jgi:two-component system, LuxR family, response regulator FixJ
MNMTKPLIYVVDDDDTFRKSLQWLLESVGLAVRTFSNAAEFLEAYVPGSPGCLVLDIRMPGMSGLQLQDQLASRGIGLPVIFLTGHGDVPMAVAAVKKGALDFIQKPYNDQQLLDLVNEALKRDAELREREARSHQIAGLVASMTPREREVMDAVVSGKSNKIIAEELGVTIKTVEAHRARVMEKMGAESLAHLVHLVMTARGAGVTT